MSKVRTQLDKERQFKKLQGEGEEYLDTITQEDEAKAADAIIEKGKEADKATAEDKAKKIEELEKTRRWTKKEYVWKLGEMCNEMAKHIDLPKGWKYWINCGKDRLNVTVTSPDGKTFGRGIIPTGMTTYDFHAIGVLLTQAENTIDQIMERGAYRKSSIILPQ
jgi:hypothetical protein